MTPQEESVADIKEEEDVGDLHDLVDASLRFTTMLKKKGVSQATLTVAVRNRPLARRDKAVGAKASTRVVDDKVVVVMDPREAGGGRADPRDAVRNNHKAGIPGQGHKDKEKRYVFDRAFDTEATNQQVYKHVVQALIGGLLKGLNATIFAYGATGSGKTHTMVGTERDPGLMVLSLRDVFRHISREPDKQWEVTCSYLEVYNEEIYDLLTASPKALDLREDPELGPQPAGLRKILVTTPEKIFSLLKEGNRRRKTESTDANATSSRSHAVLEVVITRTDRNHYEKQVSMGKLTLVDLAGSERASETNNRGHQLKDGANINRSLLALANCINALGKRRRKGFVFVPFRNSKLTRLLKDGLCGNSRTAMVATVSCANTQYHHTLNTLKYADRAKEIKTHVRRNQGTVQEHVVEYQRIIDSLQRENQELKEQLAASDPAALQAALLDQHPDDAEDPLWVEATSAAINKAAVERLAQHRGVEAAEDAARRAEAALGAVEAELEARGKGTGAGASKWSAKAAALSSAEELRAQRAALAAAADASKQDRARLSAQVAELEAERTAKMAEVASAPPGEGRERLKLEAAAARRELERVASKENLTTCDAVIKEQAAVISNLWKVLEWAGVSQSQALDLAAQHAAPRQQPPGPPQHDLALGTLAPPPPAAPPPAAQPGAAAPVGTVRLEQLLTGSAAQQLYAQWTDHRESSRHSLSTPDAGPRRQSLSLNKSSRSSSNAANLQKLQRRSPASGPPASRSSQQQQQQQQQHPDSSSAPKSAKASSSSASGAAAAAASAAPASSRGGGSRSAAPLRGSTAGKKKAAAAADPSDPADPGREGPVALSAEHSEWVEVTGTESDISDTGGGRIHPRARHPGSRIPANANPSGSYSSSARPRANSHRDGTSASTNIPRYAALRRAHRPKSSNVKVRLSGTFSRPQSSNQARKPHQPLSAKVAPTQPKPAPELTQASSSVPLDASKLDTPTQPLVTPAEPVPESPNAWGPKEQELAAPGQQRAFGFASGAGYSADSGSRRDTKDSVDEEARPETSLPEHHRRSPDPKSLQQPQEQGGVEGPPPAAAPGAAQQGRNPSARTNVRMSAESDITPTTAARPNQVAPAHHQRNVSRSFDPATLQQQQQQQQQQQLQQQPPKSAAPPRLEVNVAPAEKHQHEGDPALSKMVSPTRRGISKLLSLSRIRRRSSSHVGQGPE